MQEIKLLMLDVDGVLTDGKIYLTDAGEEMKAFFIPDGTGIRLAQDAGIRVAFVSCRYSNAVARRAAELSIEEVYQNVSDKVEVYRMLKKKYELTDDQICYVGDDVQDLEVMKLAGLSYAVANAADEIKKVADFVTDRAGGQGAVREVVTRILSGRPSSSGRDTAQEMAQVRSASDASDKESEN